MYGHLNVKFVNAKQAKETYQYRDTKEQLYKTNAAVRYNKWTEELSETCRVLSQK